MKGHRLIISILAKLSFALATLMVALNLYPSWSQYARSLEEPLLLATLSSISSMFLIRSFTHPESERELTKVFGKSVRLKHINRYTGFFFLGVLCTPVTHPYWLVETLHLAFTGLAIGTAYFQLMHYFDDKIGKAMAMLGSVIGIAGFCLALVLHLYSVGLGELIAALPILIFISKTNK